MAEKFIDKEQLRIGMFVHIDLPWMKHPFLSNSFKISNQQQLNTIRKLKIAQLRIDPDKSDAPAEADKTPAPVTDATGEDDRLLWEEKKQRIKMLKERRVKLNRCAKRYTESVSSIRNIMSFMRAAPAQAVEEADQLVSQMVDELSDDRDTTVQLVNMRNQDENTYHHCVNVAALAMVLGRSLNLGKEKLKLLGMGALFHDIGHQQVPYKILRKKEPLTRAERQIYERHPIFGAEIAARIRSLPNAVMEIISHHHECMDGSGYPKGLRGDSISIPARIIAIVNRYDNLCNGVGASRGVSPYEAISHMYSKERERYEQKFLTTFISNLGVYPPGSVVKLEDGRIAVVISINPKALLKPRVLVYSPEIPQEEAPVLELEEEGLGIAGSLRRSELPVEVLDYLNISDTVSYYFDSSSSGKGPG